MNAVTMGKLQKDLERVIEVCRGMALPFTYFFESKTGLSDLQPFSERLAAKLPDHIPENERDLYLHFFKSSIAFIFAACPVEDHVILSLNKLAPVFLRKNGDQTVYERMLANEEACSKTPRENKFFAVCLEEHRLFREHLTADITPEAFSENVSNTIDRFLEDEHLYMSDDIYDDSAVQICMSVMVRELQADFYKTMVKIHEK